jgi:hypothetical protein
VTSTQASAGPRALTATSPSASTSAAARACVNVGSVIASRASTVRARYLFGFVL